MDDMQISVEQFTGSIELKTWFEADMQPSGDWLLTGKSCAIHRRMDGSIRDVKFHKTGCTMTIPVNYEPPSFFARLLDRSDRRTGMREKTTQTNDMAEHCRQAGCQVLTPCGVSALHPTALVVDETAVELAVTVAILLAALRGLVNNSTRADWPADLIDAAEAAIAKATGAV